MKCPSCSYRDGYFKGEGHIDGINGEFYKSKELVMERGTYLCVQAKPLYACPKCGITFIEVRK